MLSSLAALEDAAADPEGTVSEETEAHPGQAAAESGLVSRPRPTRTAPPRSSSPKLRERTRPRRRRRRGTKRRRVPGVPGSARFDDDRARPRSRDTPPIDPRAQAKKKKAKRDSEEKASPAPAPAPPSEGRASPRLEEFTSYDDKAADDDDAAAVTPEDSADDVVVQAPAEIDSDDGDEADTPLDEAPRRAEVEDAHDDAAAARRLAVQALEMGISAAADDIPEARAGDGGGRRGGGGRDRAAPRGARPPGPDACPAGRPAADAHCVRRQPVHHRVAASDAAAARRRGKDRARDRERGNLRVGADGLLAAAPHPDYDARQEGQLLTRQPTLDKTDPTLEEREAMRASATGRGAARSHGATSAQSSPNGVEATSVSFDAEDDASDAALLDAVSRMI